MRVTQLLTDGKAMPGTIDDKLWEGRSWEQDYLWTRGLTGPILMQCVNWSSALMCSRHSSIAQDLSHVLCQDSYTLPMATWESETITETGVAVHAVISLVPR